MVLMGLVPHFGRKVRLKINSTVKDKKEFSRGSLDSPLMNNVKHQENGKLSQG